ncbi:MAG: amino acid ABC transporter permease [Thermoleophilaceae bacterium]|jgi:His/Glu/Gln/Arg/opine family amino acid ABC transporter permease subunit
MGYLFDPDNWEWLTTGNNLRFLLEGFLVNLEIAAIAIVFSLIFGLLLALARLSRLRPLGVAAGVWVDIWRNLPLIFIILYLALALPAPWKDFYESNVPGFFPEALQSGRVFAGILGLVLYNSAVIAEIMRAGILSLDRGQGEAAASLGLTYPQQLRYVILPQGLRRMVPATVSQVITLNKDTTLVSIIAIQEVVRHGRILSSGFTAFTGGGTQAPLLQVFIFIGALFVVTNFALSRLSRRLEIRERKRTGGTAGPVMGLEDQTALAAEAS